ncbi:hypothetical protein GOQ30_07605 [Flavobacterium sp. TP390]|uniref:Uncharacterized protein n=1 Tax=Flavobacterium profundi TaxID=1774945 RepID=A0A6I4IL63_9FLAO|nr:hypothetical protein [Flavobacterium profundi]MVO09031.1 hypothetical protein [Flavobacterium profundi]
MEKKSDKYFKIGLIIFFVLFYLINRVLVFKNVVETYKNKLCFKVESIDENINGYIRIFSKGELQHLVAYNLTDHDLLEVGDILYKKKCDNILCVLRFNDETNKYEVFKKIPARNYLFLEKWTDCK